MMARCWRREGARVVALFLLALILGWLLQQPFLLLALSGWGYLGWHFSQMLRLHHWLERHKTIPPVGAKGIWREIHVQLEQLQNRNRKRKRKLTDLLKRFQKFTKALPDAFVVMDKNFTIEWFNKVSIRLLGLQPGKDTGLRITDLLRAPVFVEYVALGDERPESLKMRCPCDPDIVLRVHLVPYSEKRFLLIARDITHTHNLEQIRRDFVANFSHELRTPMTVVIGFLETLLMREQPCHPECRRPLTLMSQQTQRMQNIVNDLLLLSQLEGKVNGDERPVEIVVVTSLLEDIVIEARALSGEQEHLIDIEADETVALRGNAKELASAFSNLIFNAIHYTPAGGNIWIRWFADGTGAHLEIQDTGDGIAKQHIPRLTERFYRVDTGRSRARGGTGLGLAIVKHVLNRHRATLHIDSRLGIGSTFCCDFPANLIVVNER